MSEVYTACNPPTGAGEAHDAALDRVYHACAQTNGLNPTMFPSLRRMENEAISSVAWMLKAPRDAVGALTSGGTESILMAIKAYRELARQKRPWVREPEVLMPITVHPAFEKACHYFGVKAVHVPVERSLGMRPDVRKAEALLTRNTILIVGSAPQYAHCVVDPIEELGALAERHGLPLHVDACYGGFVLPWLERNGASLPAWDFRVPQVTSISADFHKYGFAEKGASAVLFRDAALRQHMYYSYSRWPGGIYVSPSMAGTRPGGAVACAWAALRLMGVDGYRRVARELQAACDTMIEGVTKAGLVLLAPPQTVGFAFESTDRKVDILAVADAMETRGWKMERQQDPPCLHCSVMPMHVATAPQFAADIQAATDEVRAGKPPPEEGSAALYGMMANIPDKSIVDEFTRDLLGKLYTYAPPKAGE